MASPSAPQKGFADEIGRLRAQVAELQSDRILLDKILEQSPLLISIVRAPDFVYELANPALERLAPGKQFIGRRFSEVWEDIPDPLAAILENVVQTGLDFQLEDAPYRIRRAPAGPVETVYLTYRWIPLPGPDGKADRVLTIAHETTGRVLQRKAEKELRAQAQLTTDIVGNSPAGIALLRGKDLKFQFANPAYQAILPGKQIQGKTLEEVWPELHPDLKTAFTEVLETGKPFQAADVRSSIRRHPDGQVDAAHFSWFVTRVDIPRQEGWGLLNTCIETTQLKQAEEALRETDARFRVAAQAAKFGAYDADLVADTLYWSPEMREILGYSPDAPPPPHEAIPDFIHPDDVADFRELLSRVFDPTGDGVVWHEHRIVRPDGAIRWVHLRGLVRFAGEGGKRRPIRNTGVLLDITERKLAEEERAREARMKDEFLALLGHELRNPLAAIATASQLLTGGVSPARRASLDDLIARQVDVLKRLVDDLLDLARVTQGRIDLKKETIDLSDVLGRAVATVRPAIEKRNQELVVLRPPAQQILFFADGVRIEQVITNLLTNACRYTPEGGRIELSGSREKGEIVIRCIDNGQGIPADMLERIFEPFTRIETASTKGDEGIGLGLAIVRRLAELHNGTVTAESGDPRKGTEFTVRLPFVEPPPPPRTTSRAAPRTSARRNLSLVVVEDSPDVAQPLVAALEQAGHKVRLFSDAESALRGLARLRPAAIVLDMRLPGMDGRELAAKLREKPSLRNTLFVAVSGYQRDIGSLPDPFDYYFVKPVDLGDLLELIETQAVRSKDKRACLSGSGRVLVIEDHPHLAEVTAEVLRLQGMVVQVAGTGRAALETASDFQPQLVLCDWHLPDMRGEDVVKALRRIKTAQRPYVAILTAKHRAEIQFLRNDTRDLGVDEVIAKPLLPETLRLLADKARSPR